MSDYSIKLQSQVFLFHRLHIQNRIEMTQKDEARNDFFGNQSKEFLTIE